MEKEQRAEEWRPIEGVGGYYRYEISDAGRVRVSARMDSRGRSHESRLIRTFKNKHNGYHYCNFRSDGKTRQFRVHRLVMEAFVGVRPDGLVTDHINHDKSDNRLENLRYVTQRENLATRRGKWARNVAA